MKFNVKIMTKEELFKQKGELSWSIDLAQAKLKSVNEELIVRENLPEIPKPNNAIPTPYKNGKNGAQD